MRSSSTSSPTRRTGSPGPPSTSSVRDRSTAWARRTPRLWCVGDRGLGQIYTLDDEPARLDRRRKWRRRCGPVRGSPISSSSSSIRRSCGSVRDRPGSSHSSPKPSAVRAHLVDRDGVRSTQGQHELADLAPSRCGRPGDPRAHAGNRHRSRLPRRPPPGAEFLEERFPRSSPRADPSASTRRPTCCRSRLRSTTRAAASETDLHGRSSLVGLSRLWRVLLHGSPRCQTDWPRTPARRPGLRPPHRGRHPGQDRVRPPAGGTRSGRAARREPRTPRQPPPVGPPARMTAGSGPVRSADSTAEGWSVWLNSARSRSSSQPARSPGRPPACSIWACARCSPVAARRPGGGHVPRTSRSATTCVGCATRASP